MCIQGVSDGTRKIQIQANLVAWVSKALCKVYQGTKLLGAGILYKYQGKLRQVEKKITWHTYKGVSLVETAPLYRNNQ
jgi:hypothetical protein